MTCKIDYIDNSELSIAEQDKAKGIHIDIVNKALERDDLFFTEDELIYLNTPKVTDGHLKFLSEVNNTYNSTVAKYEQVGSNSYILSINALNAINNSSVVLLKKEHIEEILSGKTKLLSGNEEINAYYKELFYSGFSPEEILNKILSRYFSSARNVKVNEEGIYSFEIYDNYNKKTVGKVKAKYDKSSDSIIISEIESDNNEFVVNAIASNKNKIFGEESISYVFDNFEDYIDKNAELIIYLGAHEPNKINFEKYQKRYNNRFIPIFLENTDISLVDSLMNIKALKSKNVSSVAFIFDQTVENYGFDENISTIIKALDLNNEKTVITKASNSQEAIFVNAALKEGANVTILPEKGWRFLDEYSSVISSERFFKNRFKKSQPIVLPSEPTPAEQPSIDYFKNTLDLFSKKFSIDYIIKDDPSDERASYLDMIDNKLTVVVNKAKATEETPFKEYAVFFINSIRSSNKLLFKNLVKEMLETKELKSIYEQILQKTGNEESAAVNTIAYAVSKYAAEQYDKNTGLHKFIKKVWDTILEFIKKAFKLNVADISPETKMEVISKLFANPNVKFSEDVGISLVSYDVSGNIEFDFIYSNEIVNLSDEIGNRFIIKKSDYEDLRSKGVREEEIIDNIVNNQLPYISALTGVYRHVTEENKNRMRDRILPRIIDVEQRRYMFFNYNNYDYFLEAIVKHDTINVSFGTEQKAYDYVNTGNIYNFFKVLLGKLFQITADLSYSNVRYKVYNSDKKDKLREKVYELVTKKILGQNIAVMKSFDEYLMVLPKNMKNTVFVQDYIQLSEDLKITDRIPDQSELAC